MPLGIEKGKTFFHGGILPELVWAERLEIVHRVKSETSYVKCLSSQDPNASRFTYDASLVPQQNVRAVRYSRSRK